MYLDTLLRLTEEHNLAELVTGDKQRSQCAFMERKERQTKDYNVCA